MPVTAKLRHLRIAPRKVRLVADLIRDKSIEEAQTILNFVIKKAGLSILKLLNQAIANAKNNFRLDPTNLFVSKITVDEGPKLKRWRPRARGQTYQIQKKTSHITIILDEIVKKKKKIKKVKEIEKVKETPKMEKKIVKPKIKPELEIKKPKTEKVIKKIFRREIF